MSRLLIDGLWVDGDAGTQQLRAKYDDRIYGEMAIASAQQVDHAVEGAVRAVTGGAVSPYDMYRILLETSRIVESRTRQFVDLLKDEAGFTKADGENEVARCVQTLQLSAEEAKHLNGKLIPMQAAKGSANRLGYTVRVPRGVVCAITPFNSPLNTLTHKVGPALAAGNAALIKPSDLTPLAAVELCKSLLDAGLPPSRVTLVNGPGGTIGQQLLEDPRINFYAFTGSTRVGKEIQKQAGLRGTQLELGSIASTIVCHDADVDLAIPKILNAGFRKAGQVCTSVQRLYVDRRLAPTFIPKIVAAARRMKAGDPSDDTVVIGPMISTGAADRAHAWIEQAVAQGAEILTGGTRTGNVIEPTILANIQKTMKVYCEEIFAPVLSIIEFDSLDEAIASANDTQYGLAAGLFTKDLSQAIRTAQRLAFGGVHINEASSARVDVMPFGGVKDSGFGREGPAFAVQEMTEERLITVSY
ncbi:aldehyde dehydrogenase family protein [Candidimonas nitroreducens]|uniref:Aldehyde dehydrogenase n=1 Tax=Candidimonas nitroreducens TaxID=683354 RepID=A0A225MWR8_9BURK|nr:aldehyde dehydrogenase family protein [Candidimonas nitroreducens]OWT65837.1 aldehyde dehydrogenase [Candidimonas nitroreducens]